MGDRGHEINRRDFLGVLGAWVAPSWGLRNLVEPLRKGSINSLSAGRFSWTLGPPLISPANRPSDPCHAIKDPSVVRYKGRWHLFCTIRSQIRSHQIEYLSFADFRDANASERHVLKFTDGYFAAPQVFYFSPHEKWYLIYQVIDDSRKPALQPAYSTTGDIADPDSWTRPTLLYSLQPDNVKKKLGWIDFWVICDGTQAHLFFTSLDGQMWRAETKLSDFPGAWTRPSVVLRDDIYEASHTYRLKGQNKFITVIEAQAGGLPDKFLTVINAQAAGRRYYKAYLADRLDGTWDPWAATNCNPFAGTANVRDIGPHWTDSFSHGELIRDGYDELLEVDPSSLRFLFQGVSDQGRKGKKYGDIPWELGILEEDPQPMRTQ